MESQGELDSWLKEQDNYLRDLNAETMNDQDRLSHGHKLKTIAQEVRSKIKELLDQVDGQGATSNTTVSEQMASLTLLCDRMRTLHEKLNGQVDMDVDMVTENMKSLSQCSEGSTQSFTTNDLHGYVSEPGLATRGAESENPMDSSQRSVGSTQSFTSDQIEDLCRAGSSGEGATTETTSMNKDGTTTDKAKVPVSEPVEHNGLEMFDDEPTPKMLRVLKSLGHKSFRPYQVRILKAISSRYHMFVRMATGQGKNHLVAMSALTDDHVGVVASPLRSLIADQYEILTKMGIHTVMITGSTTVHDYEALKNDLLTPDRSLKLILTTPESLAPSKMLYELLDHASKSINLKIKFFIDEGHCQQEWGNSFRPTYKKLIPIYQKFRHSAFVFLTGTATKSLKETTIREFGIEEYVSFWLSMDRDNISYSVQPRLEDEESADDEIAQYIKNNHPNETGIVYCISKKKTQSLSLHLRNAGIKASAYNADLEYDERKQVQEDWMNKKIHTIVATISFGMGIDVKAVKYVLHCGASSDMINFMQGTGRAGRCSETIGKTILYYSLTECLNLRAQILLNKKSLPKDIVKKQVAELDAMIEYIFDKITCRRIQLNNHFDGDGDLEPCSPESKSACDNCKNKTQLVMKNVTPFAKEILTCFRNSYESDRRIHIAVDNYINFRSNKSTMVQDAPPLSKTEIEHVLHLMLQHELLELTHKEKNNYNDAYYALGPKSHYLLYETFAQQEEIQIKIPRNVNVVGRSDSDEPLDPSWQSSHEHAIDIEIDAETQESLNDETILQYQLDLFQNEDEEPPCKRLKQ